MKRTLLVVNDDGIAAPGLLSLIERLDSSGKYDLRVVAPEVEQSGVSHCVTIFTPLYAEKTVLPAPISHIPAYRVAGTPVDCVKLAVSELFPDPRLDLVISGINRGSNFGRLLFYSGTIAAALEAAILGYPAVAFSLAADLTFPDCNDGTIHFTDAAVAASQIVDELIGQEIPQGHFFGVELPNIPAQELRGVRLSRQGQGNITDNYIEEVSPDPSRRRFRITGKLEIPSELEDTDVTALRSHCIAVTPYALDLTAHAFREKMRGWKMFSKR